MKLRRLELIDYGDSGYTVLAHDDAIKNVRYRDVRTVWDLRELMHELGFEATVITHMDLMNRNAKRKTRRGGASNREEKP